MENNQKRVNLAAFFELFIKTPAKYKGWFANTNASSPNLAKPQ
jgi:hypothetical protein